MHIIQHDPTDEYRVDVMTGTKQTGSHHFTARASEVTATAQRIVASLGGDHGDVYQHNGTGGATYYETVEVQ